MMGLLLCEGGSEMGGMFCRCMMLYTLPFQLINHCETVRLEGGGIEVIRLKSFAQINLHIRMQRAESEERNLAGLLRATVKEIGECLKE